MAYAPPPPRFTLDDEMRRYLLGQGPAARMPGMPMAPSAPAAMPPAPVAPMPPERSAAVAPPAVELPTTPTVPGIQTPQAPAAPVPGAPPARSPVQPKVPPAVAVYAAKLAEMGNQPPKMPARPRGQGIGELGAAIASGMSGRPYDAGYFRGLDADRERKHKEDVAKFEADQAKQLATTESDSTSQRSRQAQQRMAPLLKQLGLSDEEIATLSAADISGMAKGGNIATTIAEARAKAKIAEEKRAYDQATEEAKNTREKAEEEARNARNFGQQKEIARIQANAQTGRLTDAERMRIEAETRAEERRLAAETREEERRIEAEKRKAEREGKPDPDAYRLPGTEVTDQQRLRQVINDDTQRRKLEDNVAANATIKEGIRRMREVLKNAGTTIQPKDVAAYDTARNMVYGGLTVLGKTGALQEADLPRYKSSLPDITPTAQDALALLPGVDNPKGAALDGFESTIDGVINASLSPSGVRMSSGGAQATSTPAPAPAAKPKPEAAPKPAPTAARTPPKPGMKLVQAKGGKPRWLAPEEITQAKAQGIELEEVE
jgi:hypothetical protein